MKKQVATERILRECIRKALSENFPMTVSDVEGPPVPSPSEDNLLQTEKPKTAEELITAIKELILWFESSGEDTLDSTPDDDPPVQGEVVS